MSELITGTDWALESVPGQQEYEGVFPLVITPGATDQIAYVRELNKNRLDLTEALSRHGAILFRGFPVESDQDFDRFIQAFEMENFSYAGSLSNAVRRNRTERVFTANEAPPSVEIYLHHEMAQTPLYPSRLFFYCEQAADQGGATPLCRSDALLTRLQAELPEFVQRCRDLGARYTNVMPAEADAESGQGRSWQDTLSVSTEDEAEARLNALGYSFQWQDGGSLRVTTPALPVIRQAANGKEVFFNQLVAAYCGWQDRRNEARKSICFGDGSEMPSADMERVVSLAYELVFDLPWQNGDVALVDNFLVMHGRRPFQGERRILASLIK